MQQQAQAKREAAARAADEAAYAEMVSVAMRFADEGHNRDVLFGVLLGRQCEAQRAAQIADSVAALQASRREAAKASTASTANAAASGAPDLSTGSEAPVEKEEPAEHRTGGKHAAQAKRDEPAADVHPAGALSGLWFQFLNGLRF